MSIIHEALKKIQDERRANAPGVTNSVTITQITGSPPPRKAREISPAWILSIALPLIILPVLLLAAGDLIPFFQPPAPSTPVAANTAPAKQRPGIFPARRPAGNTATASAVIRNSAPFTLSGISYDGTDSIAIVNGKILKTGDHLDGVKLKTIMKDRVILSRESGDVVLKLTSD